jgi:hypothetical protein
VEVYILKKKSSEALIVASKEIGLEVYTDKTKYSRTSHIWIANYLDWLGPAGKSVNSSTKLTCLEITSHQIMYSTVLWLL